MSEHKGRKAGTPNKDKKSLQDKAAALGVDPFEFLCNVIKGDWKACGLKEILTGGNLEPVVRTAPVIPFEQRFAAAKELSQYLYSKRSSVKVSADEESGFKIVIEDYSAKEKK